MNKNYSVITALAILLIGVICWAGLRGCRDSTARSDAGEDARPQDPRTSRNDRPGESVAERNSHRPPGPDRRAGGSTAGEMDPFAETHQELRRPRDAKLFSDYLERHGRSASSLSAVFKLTHDPDIAEELLEHADDHQVIRLMAYWAGIPQDEKISHLRRYLALTPDDAAGYFMLAAELTEPEQQAERDELVMKSMSTGKLTHGLGTLEEDLVEAIRSTKSGDLENEIREILFVEEEMISQLALFTEVAISNCLSRIGSATTSGEKARLMAEFLQGTAPLMKLPDRSVSAIGGFQHDVAFRLLPSLPGDLMLETVGMTADAYGRYLGEAIEHQGDRQVCIRDAVAQASPPDVSRFYQIKRDKSPEAAMEWLGQRIDLPLPALPPPTVPRPSVSR